MKYPMAMFTLIASTLAFVFLGAILNSHGRASMIGESPATEDNLRVTFDNRRRFDSKGEAGIVGDLSTTKKLAMERKPDIVNIKAIPTPRRPRKENTVTPTEDGIRVAFDRRKETVSSKNATIHKMSEHQVNTKVESADCRAVMQKYDSVRITDIRLKGVYQTCNPGAGNATIEIGPKLLDSVFGLETFQANCDERHLRFNGGHSAKFAALASIQGSGNTWARILLEDMTGIYTGSVYRDGMAQELLIGSQICALDNTIIVKTHRMSDDISKCNDVTHANFKNAIYLVRNPYYQIIAEFNRRNSGKVDVAPKEAFRGNEWDRWVNMMASRWFTHVKYWLEQKIPVHVLVYEELTKNTLWELYKVAQFLDYSVDFHRMGCIKYRTGVQATFLRQKPNWLQPELLYSHKQKEFINQKIRLHMNGLARKYNVTNQFKSYILK